MGAAAAGAIAQYFENVSSVSGQHILIASGESCSNMMYLGAVLPLALFSFLPSAHQGAFRGRESTSKICSLLGFWAILFVAVSANHLVLDFMDNRSAGNAAWGASSLAVLLGVAAGILSGL